MGDSMKISAGTGPAPIPASKPDVPDVVGGGGELAKKLKQYNKEGKQGY